MDFEGGKSGRKRLKAKERQLPVLHDAPFTWWLKRLGGHGAG